MTAEEHFAYIAAMTRLAGLLKDAVVPADHSLTDKELALTVAVRVLVGAIEHGLINQSEVPRMVEHFLSLSAQGKMPRVHHHEVM